MLSLRTIYLMSKVRDAGRLPRPSVVLQPGSATVVSSSSLETKLIQSRIEAAPKADPHQRSLYPPDDLSCPVPQKLAIQTVSLMEPGPKFPSRGLGQQLHSLCNPYMKESNAVVNNELVCLVRVGLDVTLIRDRDRNRQQEAALEFL